MNLGILRELGEWPALGFYEACDLPWPQPVGRAFRRLYEHFDVAVPDSRLLLPCEPLPGAWNRESHQVWHAARFILGFNHNSGLSVSPDIARDVKARFPQHCAFIDALVEDLGRQLPCFGGYTHSNPDIRRVVGEGFDAMEAELDGQLALVRAAGAAADAGEVSLLEALKDYTVGVRAFHGRACEAVESAAARAAGERRRELTLVARGLRHGFLRPAQSFIEGLLAVNLCWMLDGCDSLGRLDQALGGLFERDLADGVLDIRLARRLLDELWGSFERLNGWNLQLGGYTPEGHDGCNRLTFECVAACGRNHFRRPNVALRVTRHTPDTVLDAALDVLARGSGRPALYNDDLYIETLCRLPLGLTPEDAREVAFGGCTETMVAGLSNCGSLEGSLNLAKALELALFDGRDPLSGQQLGPPTGGFAEFATYTDFEAAVREQIRHMTDRFAEHMNGQLRQRFNQGDPKLYRTFFTRDCVRRRKSFEAGGARYNWSVVSYQGIANLIDGLAAVRTCVFERGRIPAADLLAALSRDFEGYEALRQELFAAPKFGNDDDTVDRPGAEVIRFAWERLLAHQPPRGGRYLPSCILFTTYHGAGLEVGATPDGRRAREVLTDSVGAAQGRDVSGPTALLNSVAKLPLSLAIGTPVLNVRFQKRLMADPQGRRTITALVRTFFARGGMQIQFSALDREEMLAAQREPTKHADLIVRIGGYSEYFVALPPALQASVIARTEHGL
ncbi:MAG: Benzylsuccinate synthase alpha subunit [Lentisphaerae bacterium ADurb.BinA184]|nr:MAG: Benzylsuccinate synthase alpha subunit [Lentisphaerae bacterium ADurb.BinA184]